MEKSKFSRLKTELGMVTAIYFHKPEEPFGFLSNWYLSDFTVGGIKYSSCEQYIMEQKCKILGDNALADQIMATDDVAAQQRIARNTANYSETIWNGLRQVIALRGLYAKFSQNDTLKQQLLETGDAYLVECAWSDKTWACGIGLDSSDKEDIEKWKGTNILGFALMEVREMLIHKDS